MERRERPANSRTSDLKAVYADPMEVCAVIYCLSRVRLMPVYSIAARIPVGVGSWLDMSTIRLVVAVNNG